MAISRSYLRSSSLLLGSVAALSLAYGCAIEATDPEGTAGTSTGGSSIAGSGGTAAGGKSGATGGSTATGGTGTAGAGGTTGGSTATGGTGTAGAGGTTGGTTTSGGAGGTTGGTGNPAGGAPNAGMGGDSSGAGSSAGGMSGGGSGGSAGESGGSDYNPDFEEFVGKDCDVSEPMDVNEDTLPDLFLQQDGTRMTQKSQWACRRAQIKKAVEKYYQGPKPGRPDTVTGSVSNTMISVHVEHGGKSADFSVTVSLPSGATGPVPAIIGLGGGSLDRSILTSEGVASISYNNGTISNEGSRNGLFSNIYGSTGASAQVGWAWGVSRIIDVLVDERDAGRNNIIDPTAIGITGCSRLGKGAFTIGAFDERIALGIPQESGTGGVSALRVVNTNPGGPNGKSAQTISSAWTEAQGWFGTAFGNYRNNVNVMPVDTHSLVAMYAPRGLLVLDNSRIGELGASAQHAATAAGGQVFKALGVEKNVAYHGGNPSDPHNHCMFYASQAEPLRRAIRAHLTRKAPADGRMEPQPAGTADLTKWIEWETPTLQ